MPSPATSRPSADSFRSPQCSATTCTSCTAPTPTPPDDRSPHDTAAGRGLGWKVPGIAKVTLQPSLGIGGGERGADVETGCVGAGPGTQLAAEGCDTFAHARDAVAAVRQV